MFAKLLILLAVVGMVGCGTNAVKYNVPSTLLEYCEQLPLLDATATRVDTLAHHLEVIAMYGDCASRQRDSVKALTVIKEG